MRGIVDRVLSPDAEIATYAALMRAFSFPFLSLLLPHMLVPALLIRLHLGTHVSSQLPHLNSGGHFSPSASQPLLQMMAPAP
jgi:hypothetical protein